MMLKEPWIYGLNKVTPIFAVLLDARNVSDDDTI